MNSQLVSAELIEDFITRSVVNFNINPNGVDYSISRRGYVKCRMFEATGALVYGQKIGDSWVKGKFKTVYIKKK